MALFFSNIISVSAQLCFKKTLECLGMNHVIKDESKMKLSKIKDETVYHCAKDESLLTRTVSRSKNKF